MEEYKRKFEGLDKEIWRKGRTDKGNFFLDTVKGKNESESTDIFHRL